MTGRNLLIGVSLAVGIVASSGSTSWSRAAAAAGDPHAYFNALVARGDFWKGYSFRPVAGQPISSVHYANQLKHPQDGGYAHSGSAALWVNYNPSTDTDPQAQDAAKIVIPAFTVFPKAGDIPAGATLAAPMSASTPGATQTITFSRVISVDQNQGLKIDNEIVTIEGAQSQSSSMFIKRGQYGTTAAAHSTGAAVLVSSNSLLNMVHLPVGTTDGNVYFFTWDVYWTSSFVSSGLTNHKAFQFTKNTNGVWLQPGLRYDGSAYPPPGFNSARDLGVMDYRAGHPLGSGNTSSDPILPLGGRLIVKPNTWTRYWVRIDQRASAEDPMDAWGADETQNAVQLYTNIPTQVAGTPGAILKFWVEFDTSQTLFVRGDFRDLVAYMRNFVVLKNPADVSVLLQRPVAGLLPPQGPSPPQNLRILTP